MTDRPITVAEAKTFLRVDGTNDDVLIGDLIDTAAASIEAMTGLVCESRSIVKTFDGFSSRMALHRAPVTAITAIAYVDADGVDRTLNVNQLELREFAGAPVLVPASGVTLPDTDGSTGAVAVTFTAGYATNAAAPATLRTAARLLVADWFDNRAINGEVPNRIMDLLAPLRLVDLP